MGTSQSHDLGHCKVIEGAIDGSTQPILGRSTSGGQLKYPQVSQLKLDQEGDTYLGHVEIVLRHFENGQGGGRGLRGRWDL